MVKVLNIQDFSSYTKSSGNIALPLFEAANINITLLPTSLLSTQTDGWDNVFKVDLTDGAMEIAKTWKREGIKFDVVQVGYLASVKDFALINYIILNLLNDNALIILDPVMGDNGQYYTEDRKLLLDEMKALIKTKQENMIITPNYTEACFLLGIKPELNNFNKAEFFNAVSSLSSVPIIVTSLPNNSNAYISGENDITIDYNKYDYSYPGTGDLFTTIFTIYLIKKRDIIGALKFATELASQAVKYSKEQNREYRDGVLIYHAIEKIVREKI